MTELKLRQLHRGFVLTDFENNEIGIKDGYQAIEEIKKLLKLDEYGQKESEEEIVPEKIPEKIPILESVKKPSYIELHRQIFEMVREQIESIGSFNGAKIARELGVNNSTVHNHIKKMQVEIDDLIKKKKGIIRQEEIENKQEDKQEEVVQDKPEKEPEKDKQEDIQSEKESEKEPEKDKQEEDIQVKN